MKIEIFTQKAIVEQDGTKPRRRVWENIKAVFTTISRGGVSFDVLEKMERDVEFGKVDGLTMWDYLREAQEWGEVLIDEQKRSVSMTILGDKRWRRLADNSQDEQTQNKGIPDKEVE